MKTITLSFCVGLALACVASGQDVTRPYVLLPRDLGELAFGDPLLVPVAMVNPTGSAIEIPRLADGDHSLLFRIESGTATVTCSYVSCRGYLTEQLPANSMAVTVLPMYCWSSTFAREYLRTGTATVSFFDPKHGARNGEESEKEAAQLQWHPKLCASAISREGNSLRMTEEQFLAKFAANHQGNPNGDLTGAEDGQVCLGLFTAVMPGSTPLSWTVDNLLEWFRDKSRVTNAKLKYVKPGTKLSRLIEFGEAVENMREPANIADLGSYKAMVSLLRDSSLLERQFFMSCLSTGQQTPYWHCKFDGSVYIYPPFRELMMRELPENAARFTTKPSLTVTSEYSWEKAKKFRNEIPR